MASCARRGRDETIDQQQVVDVALGVHRRTPLNRSEQAEHSDQYGHQTDTGELTAATPLAELGDGRPVLAEQDLLRLTIAFGDAGIEERAFRTGQLQ